MGTRPLSSESERGRTRAEPVDAFDVERLIVRLQLAVHGSKVDEAAAAAGVAERERRGGRGEEDDV